MKRVVALFLSLIMLDVFAANCPTGYISYEYGANLQIDADCPQGTTQIGEVPETCDDETKCFTDFICDIGANKIKTSIGISAMLYSQRVTSPSLNIALDNTTCYAPLGVGRSSSAINVSYDNSIYHTTALKQCRVDFDASVTPAGTSSQAGNRLDWSMTVNNRTISGISYCGNGKPESGDMVDAVPNSSSDLEANYYCYCRIIAPFVSDWWYATRYTKYGAAGCDTYCYAQCADSMKTDLEMRTGLYNSMK